MMEKIIHNLPEAELTIIGVPKDQRSLIKWSWENKEFRYKENMYDIVRQVLRNDSIIYYCVNDKKEELLNSNLKDFIQRNIDNELPQNKKLNLLLGKLIKDYIKDEHTVIFMNIHRDLFFKNPAIHLNSVYISVATPPPKNKQQLNLS